jgi:HEAT repeat protein
MMPTVKLLERYHSASWDDEARLEVANVLLERVANDVTVVEDLLHILNEDGNSAVRLVIVRYLASVRPASALRALTKEMFDPDPFIRSQAAIGVADYNDARVLAPSLAALFDALPDPATHAPADRAIRTVTGRAPEKISISERERVKLGEHPETIWPEYFSTLPPKAD